MSYEEMSDFEINLAVARIEYPEHKHIISVDNLEGISSTVIMSKPISETGTEKHYLNYCQCPDNAWPIMLKNGVSTILTETCTDDGDLFEAFYMNGHIGFDDDVIHAHILFSTLDKNPLRAAMICFLKMKDDQQ